MGRGVPPHVRGRELQQGNVRVAGRDVGPDHGPRDVVGPRGRCETSVSQTAVIRRYSIGTSQMVMPAGAVSTRSATGAGGWVLSRSANPQPSQGIAPRRRLLARTYRHLDLDERRTLFRMVE